MATEAQLKYWKTLKGKAFWKGHKHSKESLAKMSKAHLAKPYRYWLGKEFSPLHRKRISENNHFRKMVGEKNWIWKGDNACYTSKHQWVYRHFGTPSKCEFCGTDHAKRFDWANVSGKYIREKTDWIRLCKSCHTNFDDIINKGWETRRLHANPQ